MEKPKSLFISAQTVVAHALWGICREKDEISVSQHRERIEKNLPDLNLSAPVLASIKECLHSLETAYNDAYQWFGIYKENIESFKNNEIDIFLDEEYRLSNFITLLGQFDDISFVNKFVEDQQRNILDRFYFSCFYCIENEIKPLWLKAKNKHDFLRTECRDTTRPALVQFWSLHADLTDNVGLSVNFLLNHYDFFKAIQIFMYAIQGGHETAVLYFLYILEQVARCIVSLVFFNRVFAGEPWAVRYPKIIHYVFSRITPGEQKNLLRYDFDNHGCVSIWHHYIHPQLISLMPYEIQRHQNELPEAAYAHFLMKLVLKMTKMKDALYREVFQAIWRIGSVQNKRCFLENYQGVLWILFRAKYFECSRCVLKDASLEERKQFFFESMEEFLFENASFRNDQHAIRKYLLLFTLDLQENDSTVSKPTPFNSDSLNLLKKVKEKLHSTEVECTQISAVVEKLVSEIKNFDSN